MSRSTSSAAPYELPSSSLDTTEMDLVDTFEGPSDRLMTLAVPGLRDSIGIVVDDIIPLTNEPCSLVTGDLWPFGMSGQRPESFTASGNLVGPFDDTTSLFGRGLDSCAMDTISKDLALPCSQLQGSIGVPASFADEFVKMHIMDLITNILQCSCSEELFGILRVVDQLRGEVGRRHIAPYNAASLDTQFHTDVPFDTTGCTVCPPGMQQSEFAAVLDHMSTLSVRDDHPASMHSNVADVHVADPPQEQLVFTTPHITAGNLLPGGGRQCEWDNCCVIIPSTSVADVRDHLKEYHFGFLDEPRNKADKDYRVVCRWANCRSRRPMLVQNMDRHIRTSHLGATAVTCPVCAGSFTRSDARDRHVKSHHAETMNTSWMALGGGCGG
ncbi:hypothetical protein B0H21DRAFT_225127 [Amylocystis lapponica]|nr:hypothetical protein B0H21DRAFT_225127 [Amylocystis lapponica]